MAISTPLALSEVFHGQADIVLFGDASSNINYSAATFATLTATGYSVGSIKNGSTSPTGEATSLKKITNEQGDVIHVCVETKGSVGFECVLLTTSQEALEKFFGGKKVTTLAVANLLGTDKTLDKATKITTFPVFTAPIAVINESKNKTMFLPKASIASSLTLDDGVWAIKLSVTAEHIDKGEDLGTVMFISGK